LRWWGSAGVSYYGHWRYCCRLLETANPERSGDAKPTELYESAGLPKGDRVMKVKTNIKAGGGNGKVGGL
jgi:hypothetical protein